MRQVLNNKQKLLLPAVYILVFLFMLMLNFLTPLNADDFSYSFSFYDVSRIESIAQLIPSMAAHRFTMNGRVIVHGAVSFFLMLPKAVFNVFNALNVILLIYLFGRYSRDIEGRFKALLAACAFFLIWNCVPKFSQTFLWLDGSINYSWVMSVLLLFLLPYLSFYMDGKRMGRLKAIGFMLLSFVAGTCGESYSPSAVIIAFVFCFMVFVRERKIAPELLLGLVFAVLGFAFLLSAPASSGRISEFTLSGLIAMLIRIISLVRDKLMLLYLLYAASLCIALLRKCDARRIAASVILVLGGCVSLAAYSIAINFTYRHLCFATVLTVLATLMLFAELLRENQLSLPCVGTACIFVIFLFNMLLGCIDICAGFVNSLERKAIISEALANQETQVVLEQHIPSTDYGVAFELSYDDSHWLNSAVASYYGFEKVIMK